MLSLPCFSPPHFHFQIVTSALSFPHCHFHIVTSTLSLPHYHFHIVISTLSLPHCHFHIIISILSFPYSHFHIIISILSLPYSHFHIVIRLRAVPIFPLEFVKPRKDIAKTGARKPGQGKTREVRKIGTADNPLFKIKPPTFVAMSQSCHVQ